MSLSFGQFKELRDEGLTVDQIIKFEKGEVPLTSNVAGKEELDRVSAEKAGVLFPAKTEGETPLSALLKATGNVPSSIFNLARNLGSIALHPVETIKGIGGVVAGGLQRTGEKLGITEELETEVEQDFETFAEGLKERFGSLEALEKTAINDPVGFGADIVGLFSGLGGGKLLAKGRLLPETITGGTAQRLKQQAAKRFTEVLQPTTKPLKKITEKVAPKLAERKIVAFSTEGLEKTVAENIQRASDELNAVIDQIPPETRIKTQPIIDALEESKKDFIVKGTEVVAEPTAFANATQMQNIVAELGEQVSFESLRSLRQIWDNAVEKTNGFQKTMDEATLVGAKKEAANAIRKELAKDFPDVAVANAEFSFWSDVQKVLKATQEKKVGQRKPLGERAARGVGILTGAQAGAVEALILSETFPRLVRLMNSTAWRTVDAKIRTKLAELLTERKTADVNKIVGTIIAEQGLEELTE